MTKDELKKKINDLVIDKLFLAKTLLLLVVFYVVLIGMNIYYSQAILNKILTNLDKKEVLVVDYNGNKSFERIGNINIDIVSLFVQQSLRRVMELNHLNKHALFYAQQFTTKDIYENLVKKYQSGYEEMKMVNGFYNLKIIDLKLISMNKEKQEYNFEAKVNLSYIYDGGKKEQTMVLAVSAGQFNNVENDYFGLVLTNLQEVKQEQE